MGATEAAMKAMQDAYAAATKKKSIAGKAATATAPANAQAAAQRALDVRSKQQAIQGAQQGAQQAAQPGQQQAMQARMDAEKRMMQEKSQKDMATKLQGVQDARSTVGEMARGKNMYPGGNAAHSGGGPQFGRPKGSAIQSYIQAAQRRIAKAQTQR